MSLIQKFPSIQDLENAAIEDVAFLTLQDAKRSLHNNCFNAGNLARNNEPDPYRRMQGMAQYEGYDAERVQGIVLESLAWLESERLIAQDHTQQGGWYIVTRLGMSVNTERDISSYAKRAFLPKGVLRSDVAEVALAPFLAGRYDEAVRAAFTRLEVAIRAGANYGHDQYGVSMVRDAFSPGKRDGSVTAGPLADPDLEFTEREAVAHLFAGAIGYIKNPLSHRELNIDDARLAASRILLANDLMYTLAAHLEKKGTVGS